MLTVSACGGGILRFAAEFVDNPSTPCDIGRRTVGFAGASDRAPLSEGSRSMVRKPVLALALLGGALHLGGAAQASVADRLVSRTAPRVSQVQVAQFNPLDIPAAIVPLQPSSGE